jgi:hypothetical protein
MYQEKEGTPNSFFSLLILYRKEEERSSLVYSIKGPTLKIKKLFKRKKF